MNPATAYIVKNWLRFIVGVVGIGFVIGFAYSPAPVNPFAFRLLVIIVSLTLCFILAGFVVDYIGIRKDWKQLRSIHFLRKSFALRGLEIKHIKYERDAEGKILSVHVTANISPESRRRL